MSEASEGRTSLATRFLITYALAYVALIGLMGLFVERSARQALIEEVEQRLETTARLAADDLPRNGAELQEWASSVFQATGLRITLIHVDGIVLADSHSDPAVMENHGTRPEVLVAKTGQVGISRRISASTGFEQVYVAIPPEGEVITRVSLPTRVIDSDLSEVRLSILLIAALTGLLGIGVVAFLARRVARPITELTEQSLAVAKGNLEVRPWRSPVREIDQLGMALSTVAENLGRRLTEAEEASETLEVVLGAIPQGTVLVDGNDRVIYANPSAYGLLGAVPDQLQGLSPYQFQAAVREAREGREPEARVVDHGKPTRRLRAVATPFSDDDRVLLVVVDITERERAEAIRRDFVANASHELKTPVSTIIASAEALQIAVDRGDETAPSFARHIEESARQLDRMVGDLLDLSRLERETPDLAPVRLDLVVQDEVQGIEPMSAEKSISVELRTAPVLVAGNHRDLATAVRNLLENAIHYSDDGGKISVTVSEGDGGAVLSVQDSGDGIPRRDLDRVFERFYRVDSARSRATGGTGLGLAIVKHVAESHGGSVAVESELGRGSMFTMRIPLADS